jgi:hypothetical protein
MIAMKEAVKWDEYFRLPNNGLKAYFGNVRAGRSKIVYGALAHVENRDDVEKVLSEWLPHLDPLIEQQPSLYEYEKDQAAKVGPMSVMLPLKEREEDIDHYYDDIHLSAVPVNPEALNAVVKEFASVRGMKVRSEKRTWEKMRKSTNSGSPYFAKRRVVIDKTMPVHHVTPESYKLRKDEWKYCAILGWRGQEGGPSETDVKQRVVWMFPLGINIRELQVYQPLIELCQKFDLVPPWVSMEDVDKHITKLFDSKDPSDLVICTDFSKFDQHFNETCQDGAKTILEAILSSSGPEDEWLANVFPVKYNIPLAYDWEKIRFGHHGMGSGSGGTNADETLLHRALQHEAAISHGAVLNPHSMCLGDDGLLTYPGITVKGVLDTYTAHGLEMNETKQYVSKDDCIFLRRWHHKDYRVDGVCAGVYPTSRALGRLMYRERTLTEWDEKDEALRTLSILENCKYHPLADEFAHFVMERHPTHIGKDIPGFFDHLEQIAKEREATIGDVVSYTQTMTDDPSLGINNWWIVKYLKRH